MFKERNFIFVYRDLARLTAKRCAAETRGNAPMRWVRFQLVTSRG